MLNVFSIILHIVFPIATHNMPYNEGLRVRAIVADNNAGTEPRMESFFFSKEQDRRTATKWL